MHKLTLGCIIFVCVFSLLLVYSSSEMSFFAITYYLRKGTSSSSYTNIPSSHSYILDTLTPAQLSPPTILLVL
jgi:hypothetical protein